MNFETQGKPLMSFCVIAYNQEKFIREAVEGAFAQTYSPLEIILSDDGSRDDTFEIMAKLAANYQGPHTVVLNRNNPNLGIGGHVSRLFELATGELVILAAGDDISLPGRVEATFQAWATNNRMARCIYSGFEIIDENGKSLSNTGMEFVYSLSGSKVVERVSPGDFFGPAKPRIFGCAAAYSPELMQVFGPLPRQLVHEDDVLLFRALCLGPVLRIESSLVKYRLHGSNIFGALQLPARNREGVRQQETRHLRELDSRAGMCSAYERDLSLALEKSLITPEAAAPAILACERQCSLLDLQREYLRVGLLRICRILPRLRRAGLSREELRRCWLRLLPSNVLTALKHLRLGMQTIYRKTNSRACAVLPNACFPSESPSTSSKSGELV